MPVDAHALAFAADAPVVHSPRFGIVVGVALIVTNVLVVYPLRHVARRRLGAFARGAHACGDGEYP